MKNEVWTSWIINGQWALFLEPFSVDFTGILHKFHEHYTKFS